jgi:hypothetical protein
VPIQAPEIPIQTPKMLIQAPKIFIQDSENIHSKSQRYLLRIQEALIQILKIFYLDSRRPIHRQTVLAQNLKKCLFSFHAVFIQAPDDFQSELINAYSDSRKFDK